MAPIRTRMNRIFFVNRYFHPDVSATSALVSDLAFDLATERQVYVITSQQCYDNPKFRLPAAEIIQSVRIIRVPATQFGRARLIGRAVDYLSFYAAAWRALRNLVQRDDLVVAMTDPPLLSIVAMQAARRRGARLINWLQDIYPEVAVELGVPLIRGPVRSGLSYLRDQTLRRAAANVVVGQRMAEKIASRGVSSDHVHVIPNWTEDDQISPMASADNPLRREWGLVDKFVIGYSGNLGRAHEFQTVVRAAERLRCYPHIMFLFVGGGHRMHELAQIVKARGLSSTFRFFPYQDRTNLKHSLAVPDLHWISLRPSVEGMIVPSKLYGIAAAGRPTIAIMARDGEIARLVREHECGIVIEPGHAEELADTLLRLSTDQQSLVAMGSRARAMLEAHFTRRQALDRWRKVLTQAEQTSTSTRAIQNRAAELA